MAQRHPPGGIDRQAPPQSPAAARRWPTFLASTPPCRRTDQGSRCPTSGASPQGPASASPRPAPRTRPGLDRYRPRPWPTCRCNFINKLAATWPCSTACEHRPNLDINSRPPSTCSLGYPSIINSRIFKVAKSLGGVGWWGGGMGGGSKVKLLIAVALLQEPRVLDPGPEAKHDEAGLLAPTGNALVSQLLGRRATHANSAHIPARSH